MVNTFGRTRYWVISLMGGALLLGWALKRVPAQSSAVQMTFFLTTAPEAALGAPIGYYVRETNTSTTTTSTVKMELDLIAPNGTSYKITTPKATLGPGLIGTQNSTFTSSTYTNQTGAFTAKATLTDNSTGAVLSTQSVPVTVLTAPSNGVYANIGGQGPDNQLLGYTYDFETVTANLGTSALNLRTQTNLIMTDGTTAVLNAGKLANVNPATSVVSLTTTVQTTMYSTLVGTYGVQVQVFDSNNNILATETHNFTRNALPANRYAPTFTDTAALAGVNILRTPVVPTGCGGYPDFYTGGAGAAVADYDGDGLQDIFVADMSGHSHLWHNNGNGTFTDNAAAAGIPSVLQASGASFADIDNDGFPDLLILVAQGQNVLLHNNGNGTFTDISVSSGIQSESVPQNNVSATWGDYDNNGHLDLYVTVHADCTGKNTNDHLYHNNGNLTFTDVTSLLGTSTAPALTGRGLVVLFADLFQTGYVDIYVGNDQGAVYYPNVLWQNTAGVFTDVSAKTSANVKMAAMGIAIGDYNRTGVFDLFITNWGANVLLIPQLNGTYRNAASDYDAHVARSKLPNIAGGTGDAVTWGTAFYDFDNDGWEDIYMAGSEPKSGGIAVANGLMLNNQDGTFLDLSTVAGVTGSYDSMPTAVFADFNNDGFIDILSAGKSNIPHLFMNNARSNGNTNNWLGVKLVGTTSNRDGVGARVVATVAGVNLLRAVYNGGTFQGNNELAVHYGLGTATQVDTLTVYWPSGKVDVMTNIPANQKIVVTEQ